MASGKTEMQKNGTLLLKTFSITHGSAIAVGNQKRWLPSSFGYTIPTGYYPIAICDFSTGNANTALCYLQAHNNSDQSSNYFMCIRNVGSSATSASNTVLVTILFAPLDIITVDP